MEVHGTLIPLSFYTCQMKLRPWNDVGNPYFVLPTHQTPLRTPVLRRERSAGEVKYVAKTHQTGLELACLYIEDRLNACAMRNG